MKKIQKDGRLEYYYNNGISVLHDGRPSRVCGSWWDEDDGDASFMSRQHGHITIKADGRILGPYESPEDVDRTLESWIRTHRTLGK